MFLILMAVGLAGLVVMALPALGDHAHGHVHHAPTVDHAADHGVDAPDHPHATRFLPSPRAVLSFLALYGAFGNVLVEVARLSPLLAGVLGALPALAVERLLVAPLWARLSRFQASPSAPLESIVLSEAEAVTPFVRGRGVVSVAREGRLIQLSARMVDAQQAWPVRVGDKLRIESVDPARERAVVSLLALERGGPPCPPP